MGLLKIDRMIEERDVFESLDKIKMALDRYHQKEENVIMQGDNVIDFLVVKKALIEWQKIKEAGKSEGIEKALKSLKRYHRLETFELDKNGSFIIEDYEDYKNIENALLSKVGE